MALSASRVAKRIVLAILIQVLRGLFNYLTPDLMLPVVFDNQDARVAVQFGELEIFIVGQVARCSGLGSATRKKPHKNPNYGALVRIESYRTGSYLFRFWIGLAMLCVITSDS